MFTIPEQYFSFTNIVILAILIIFFLLGYYKGFFRQVVSLFGSLIAIVVAIRFSSVMASFFSIWPKVLSPLQDTLMADLIYQYLNKLCWFLLLFFVSNLFFSFLAKMLEGVHDIPVLKQISRILGGLLGFFSAIIWLLVLTTLLSMPIFKNGNQLIQESYLSTVRDGVSEVSQMIGINSYSDTINKIYTSIQALDHKDQEMIKKWLQEQGFQSH